MRTIALISTTAVVVAVAFSPSNETIVGFTPAFMPAFFAAVFLIELMTAYLLWQQFEAQGEIRLLGLSLTYLFTALLVIPTALTHPFVLNTTSILGGTPSTPVWFWVTWHLVFPLGLAASLAPWPERAVRYVRNHHVKVRQRAIGALVLGVVVLSYLFTQGLTTVPVLGGVLDYPRMAGTLGPWVVLFSVLSLVAVIIRSHPSHPLERWIVVAAAAITSDSLLTVAAGARLTVGWYAGRALALAATGVVLVGLTREVGRMYRETLISNQELREENERDALTGVFSRRAILERADALIHGPGDVAMAVVDLDHFKAVNDSYGHQVGDEVLVWIAGRMSTCLRGGDAVGRLGGEEFVVLFSGADSEVALKAGERIRQALADSTIATGAGHLSITASVGIATRISSGETASSVLGRADQALYAAKAAGRNQVKASTNGKVPAEL